MSRTRMETSRNRARGRPVPEWLVARVPAGYGSAVRALLRDCKLHTVCQSAECPNEAECFSRGTATFMILGTTCTRNCRFCAVKHAQGAKGDPLDPGEPDRIAQAAASLKLKYIVITSVTRDDLPDGGAGQFAATIRAVRRRTSAAVEVLTPDYLGEPFRTVLAQRPEVFNHNVETVPRLYPRVRPQASYRRSLEVLSQARGIAPDAVVKSGLMVGLGERSDEVIRVLHDLAGCGVSSVTIGQYLSPSDSHVVVVEYVRPEKFEEYRRAAVEAGIGAVASGPLVRSSYRAAELFALATRPEDANRCRRT